MARCVVREPLRGRLLLEQFRDAATLLAAAEAVLSLLWAAPVAPPPASSAPTRTS